MTLYVGLNKKYNQLPQAPGLFEFSLYQSCAKSAETLRLF